MLLTMKIFERRERERDSADDVHVTYWFLLWRVCVLLLLISLSLSLSLSLLVVVVVWWMRLTEREREQEEKKNESESEREMHTKELLCFECERASAAMLPRTKQSWNPSRW